MALPAYDSDMSDVGVAALIGALALIVGLVIGAALMRAALRRTPAQVETEQEPRGTDTEDSLAALVLERAPLAVLALDSSEDVLLANRRAHELGLLDRRGVVDPLREVARLGRTGGKSAKELSLPTVGLPRRVIQARVTALPLPDRVTALVIEDVTEARRVDDVRRDFVANVSHEIKTPVGALRLLADAAMESLAEVENADEARHFVERISHESARLGRLVSELLDLSRLQGAEALPEPTPVDLNAVVTEAIDRASPHAEAKGITIVRSAPASAIVPGVEYQLVTAVANLLDNAINYSPEATRVAVAVRPAGAISRGGAWEIIITDQGLGIPEADLDRIFERFYRVDPARSRATGGTGLGLAIVKHIVRNHGGEIRVWSSPGAGSSFTLRLPVGGVPRAADAESDNGSTDTTPAYPEPARSPETTHASQTPDQPEQAEAGVNAAARSSGTTAQQDSLPARRVVR